MLFLQKQKVPAVKIFPDRVKPLAQKRYAVLNGFQLHPQHLGGGGSQLVQGQAGVAIVQVVAQHIENPRLDPVKVVPGLFHALGNGVGNFKADVDAFSTQAVGVLLDASHRGLSILLPHQNCFLWADAVGP